MLQNKKHYSSEGRELLFSRELHYLLGSRLLLLRRLKRLLHWQERTEPPHRLQQQRISSLPHHRKQEECSLQFTENEKRASSSYRQEESSLTSRSRKRSPGRSFAPSTQDPATSRDTRQLRLPFRRQEAPPSPLHKIWKRARSYIKDRALPTFKPSTKEVLFSAKFAAIDLFVVIFKPGNSHSQQISPSDS